jgi:DivIVA domain-containing protein
MARKDDKQPPSTGGGAQRITALDIQQKEFRVSFRGYNEREVDEFLDTVTEELARLYSENKRLQEQTEYRQTMPLGGDAEDALRRAKDEAERIVAEARSRAASLGAAGGGSAVAAPAGFDAVEAWNRYLGRERDFLQTLAARIHEHIEAVKEDAREVRRATSEAGTSPPHSGPGDGEQGPGPAEEPAAPRLDDTAMYRPDPMGYEPGPGRASDEGPGSSAARADPFTAGSGPSSTAGDDAGPPTERWDASQAGRMERAPSARTTVAERRVTESMPQAPAGEDHSEPPAEGIREAVSRSNGSAGTAAHDTAAGAVPPVDPEDERSLRELFWGED